MTQHHILVVTESERLRDVMQAALAGEQYRVSGISASFSDVRTVVAMRPDALILDWMLGCEDHGLQVLQILRLCQPLSALPMIVCSAPIALVREIERWLRGASVQFLLKPFSLPELHHALHSALGAAETEPAPAAAVTAPVAREQAPEERDTAQWPTGQPRILTPRRDEWEWQVPDGGSDPSEMPPAGATAVVGR